eukprot:CAMPEP_0201500370 /NCGR_PEP_ID=MMETSP0151_2-20130828/81184_1 /ASSEMBLY_ACC=CAM_ASM_000257 /TAXON_ID=200890 /ORGANISM="Paramoeba atlantica, Strain 621/1 / CCAP 1560/9" /LENGTH=54 /DNA_ID=CAMNT_0047893557 /DNA_START=145 /DNA_END=309 /DNA_ORIENTATION=-
MTPREKLKRYIHVNLEIQWDGNQDLFIRHSSSEVQRKKKAFVIKFTVKSFSGRA